MIEIMPKSLFLALRNPVSVSLQTERILDAPLIIDGLVTSRPSTPPWPACADILMNEESRTWVGVCYRVGQRYKDLVQEFCSNLPCEVVRFNDLSSAESRQLYGEFGYEMSWLEIIWTNIPPNKVEVAQLDSGFWYYVNYASAVKQFEAVAFGIEDIDETIHDYNLLLPNMSHLPVFEVVTLNESCTPQ